MSETFESAKNAGVKLDDRNSFTFLTGNFARQANGAVILQAGDNVILATSVVGKRAAEPTQMEQFQDFLPLTVEYREKSYAVGKIPGSWFRRESRPYPEEILVCRMIDRPCRTLFPDGFVNEVLIMVTTLSLDGQCLPDVLAVNAASASLVISDIPFNGPIGCVRVGLIGGKFVLNPTFQELDKSDLDLVVAANQRGIVMVECKASQIPEATILEALKFAKVYCDKLIACQNELVKIAGKPKSEFEMIKVNPKIYEFIKENFKEQIEKAFYITKKRERNDALDEIQRNIIKEATAKFVPPDATEEVKAEFSLANILRAYAKFEEDVFRNNALNGKRPDGRGMKEIRPITVDVGLLPRAHGSSLFTRGETQALGVVTLGSKDDARIIDSTIEYKDFFYLHYNFPPFSTGEIKRLSGPGRREIGHGALAEKALEPVIPHSDDFPYTIRIVSEVLESNGSSSMASVCAGCLALMDAGVKIKAPVAGIAMGLIYEEPKYAILSDIIGLEDGHGDMDFKVAGTEKGITALQLDLKIPGLPIEVLEKAFEQAREGRMHILEKMTKVIAAPRHEISRWAPKMRKVFVGVDKFGLIIGKGGETVKKIISDNGGDIEIVCDETDGCVYVSGVDIDHVESAVRTITEMTSELIVGKIYRVRVVDIREFGAFVEVIPSGKEGLIHVSELSDRFVKSVRGVVRIGQELNAELISIDDMGKRRFSLRSLLKKGINPFQAASTTGGPNA